MRAARLTALALLLAAAGCVDKDASGPAEVKFDRDACKSCSMVISDRHFVAQVRGGPRNEAVKFDDIGCAIRWLEKQPWAKDATTRVWVARHTDGAWLDAAAAHYVAGKTSPMGFNFGAVDGTAEGVDFETLKAQVLATRPMH